MILLTNMEELTKKWLERAKYDLDTAKAMLNARRYLYVTFMCQQAIEKLLKAIIIEKGGEILRTHNLVRLAEKANVYNSLDEHYKVFLAELTPFAIEARYGDYRENLSEIANKRIASKYYEKAVELFKWLRRKLNK